MAELSGLGKVAGSAGHELDGGGAEAGGGGGLGPGTEVVGLVDGDGAAGGGGTKGMAGGRSSSKAGSFGGTGRRGPRHCSILRW